MKIVAVTSCSVGIAHTYMSAGAIEKACKRAGVSCKVETQGSIGIEDRISKKDIAAADLVIFAADVPVRERERFADKIVYECGTEDFIKFPEKALKDALAFLESKA